jgi:pilus assembly protein CpaE
MEVIKVAIAGYDKRFGKKIRSILKQEDSIHIVGESFHSKEVMALCAHKQPDILLVDEELEGQGWRVLVEEMNQNLALVMVMVVLNKYTKGSMKEAISAGAKEILEKPSLQRTLVLTLHKLYSREEWLRKDRNTLQKKTDSASDAHVISVFSPKGGVGKTTLATNLAIALAGEGKKVLVMDVNLQFGDSAMAFKLSPEFCITDMAKDIQALSQLEPDEYIAKHPSGVYVLSSPKRPEDAAFMTTEHIRAMVDLLKKKFRYIVMDCPNYLNDLVWSCFQVSESVLLVSTLDITTIKNVKNALKLMLSLGLAQSKIKLVFNKVNEKFGIRVSEVEDTLGMKAWASIPSDDPFVIAALNLGEICVLKNPKNPVSKALLKLKDGLVQDKNLHHFMQSIQTKKRFFAWRG